MTKFFGDKYFLFANDKVLRRKGMNSFRNLRLMYFAVFLINLIAFFVVDFPLDIISKFLVPFMVVALICAIIADYHLKLLILFETMSKEQAKSVKPED